MDCVITDDGQAVIVTEWYVAGRALAVLRYCQTPDTVRIYHSIFAAVELLDTLHRQAIDEDYHIGILFDCPRLMQVGKQRCFVDTLLNLARQLRQQDNGTSNFFAGNYIIYF